MTQPVSTFQGEALYLDTMIFYTFLRVQSPPAESLFRSIVDGNVRGLTSALTFDELAHRMLLALIRDVYTGSPLDVLRKDERRIIAEFFPKLEPQLVKIQSLPNLLIVDVAAVDVVAMRKNIRDHLLRPRDALHLAAMQKVGCFHLVSQDSDFDHIPGITRYTLM